MPRRLAALVLLMCLPGAAAVADELVPKRGPKVEGAIVSETDDELVFNIYWSRNPGVTNPDHVIRLPKDGVKRFEREPHPEVEVFRRLAALKDDDVSGFLGVGTYAKEHKLKQRAAMCFALACKADPEDKEALKAIGGKTKWASALKGNVFLDDGLRDLLVRYAAEGDPAARVSIATDLKARGFGAKPYELERYRRSALQPKGYQEDRPLAYRSDAQPGAVYTLFVPKEYVPWKPWPLVIGLHGGGADGKAGDEVVGSGPSAMMFYQRQAAQHGYIVACPNALTAGWGSKDNEAFVRDVITELKLLYHIDIDRVYLTGHSMGGFGTWALGPVLAPDLAAISPMAGGGGQTGKLVETKTPIFIYHSDNDYVSVTTDRNHAKALKGTDLDFVYTELPGQGHGFPASVQAELFEFFGPRRRYDKKSKTAWPRSSFLGKPTKEEET